MFFFFNDTATTEIYTLSLYDALPISGKVRKSPSRLGRWLGSFFLPATKNCQRQKDRKSTRLNSSHPSISYAVFCLKKKSKERVIDVMHDIHRIRVQMTIYETT